MDCDTLISEELLDEVDVRIVQGGDTGETLLDLSQLTVTILIDNDISVPQVVEGEKHLSDGGSVKLRFRLSEFKGGRFTYSVELKSALAC